MSPTVRRNERSWAISMISDINMKLQTMGLSIVRAGGENTISTGHRSMFPDVLLYGDQNQTQILQGWELKLPDTPITDIAFIEDAQRKAVALGLNSCFIWNFTAGVLYVKNEAGHFEIARQWNETNHIRTRTDVERYREDWLSVIEGILIEINRYLATGTICGSALGDLLSDSVIAGIIERNKSIACDELNRASVADARIGAYLSVWWGDVRSEYRDDEPSMFSAYAKTVLLNWTNRIIFSHLIKNRHNAARAVERLGFDSTIEEANTLFEQITAECDFYSIFSGMEHNSHLPPATWHDLMDLNIFLSNNGVQNMEQTALQTVLERTVAVSTRELNGQFTTPAILADMLVSLSVLDWTGDVIDPCCGTGSIPKAFLREKKQRMGNTARAVATTWASDKFSFPLQLTNISMADVNAINLPNRIFKRNVFSIRENDEVHICDPENGEQLVFHIPQFRTIASNLPFIPFENISDDDRGYIDRIIERVYHDTRVSLSGRNDYYSYIVFSLYDLLETNGRLGIITSNSWLGTAAGRDFFKALGHYFRMEQIHTSGAGRWFDNAKVVTVITVLSKREHIMPPNAEERTAFCTWNIRLANLKEDEAARESIVNSALLDRELDPRVMSYKAYTHAQISELLGLNVSISALFHDIQWLLRIQDKLTPINTIFEVVRGERRGWDTMFYPADGHGIEPCYIKRVLRNSREITALQATADRDAFCCSAALDELRDLQHVGALTWISRFENGVNGTGRPLPEVLARRNLHWYEMKDTNTADLVTTMNPDRRLFFAKFDEPTFINQRLIGLKRREGFDEVALYHALLNSILGMFYIEAIGFGRGLGALDINKTTLKNALMLDPRHLSQEEKAHILQAFEPLCQRPIMSTTEELRAEDRRRFDMTVLSAYGIEAYYEQIKNSVCSMQRMRLSVR